MEWTEKHVILCQEILVSEPYKYKARTLERGKVWDEIADRLNNIKDPKSQSDGFASISSFFFQSSKQK